MVADAEILLDQPLLSESKDEPLHEFLNSEDETETEDDSEDESEVNEDIYDAEYFMKQRKELARMSRLLTMQTIVLAAPLVYCIWYEVKLPVPFYCTYQVFGYPLLWVVAILFFMFAIGYIAFDWWRTTRPVVKDE